MHGKMRVSAASECGAGVARWAGGPEVVGSNPTTPTSFRFYLLCQIASSQFPSEELAVER